MLATLSMRPRILLNVSMVYVAMLCLWVYRQYLFYRKAVLVRYVSHHPPNQLQQRSLFHNGDCAPGEILLRAGAQIIRISIIAQDLLDHVGGAVNVFW